MRRAFPFLLGLGLTIVMVVPVRADIAVQVQGAVNHAGALRLKDSARLSDAALAAGVQPDAYLPGAAWLRPSLVTDQQRLRAGVLFDLETLQRRGLVRGDAALARTARALRSWIASLPVTGRQAPAQLAPRVVEATPAENWPVRAGDTLFYPARPVHVRVLGAVQRACTLPFQPLQGAPAYLSACPRDPSADRDWAYVIEPDGRVFRRGVALWNLSPPLALAPGALIYVPVAARDADAIDPGLNDEIAAFLATQVLPGPEAGR